MTPIVVRYVGERRTECWGTSSWSESYAERPHTGLPVSLVTGVRFQARLKMVSSPKHLVEIARGVVVVVVGHRR